jgi:hypothetical protein
VEHHREEILERGGERATKEVVTGLAWVATAVVIRLVAFTMLDPGPTMSAFLWAPILLGAFITARGAFAHAYIWNRTNQLVDKATSDLEILERQS